MSARAAWRLETLGFSNVYRYTAGEADWFAAGLPIEGRLASVPRAQDVARRDVPTCGLSELVGAVCDRVQSASWDQCIVVNEQRVVLGRLRQKELGADDGARVETVMESGPTTIRPDTMLDGITKRMQQRRVESILVSTSDGQLIGVLYRADAKQRLAGAQAAN
jgi:predicted transcriptional regulator